MVLWLMVHLRGSAKKLNVPQRCTISTLCRSINSLQSRNGETNLSILGCFFLEQFLLEHTEIEVAGCCGVLRYPSGYLQRQGVRLD